MYVGKSLLASLMKVRKGLVIDTHQMQDSSVDIVDVRFISHGFKTKLVCFTVTYSAFHPTAGDPAAGAPGHAPGNIGSRTSSGATPQNSGAAF